MRTIHVALSQVAKRFGLAQIVPDAAGFAELEVDGALSVYLRVQDDHEVELSARVPEFGDAVTPELIEALMVWNGRARGLRFAVEPDRGGVVLGRRIDIRAGAADALALAVEAFVIAVADWRRSGAEEMMSRVKRHAEPLSGGQMTGLFL